MFQTTNQLMGGINQFITGPSNAQQSKLRWLQGPTETIRPPNFALPSCSTISSREVAFQVCELGML